MMGRYSLDHPGLVLADAGGKLADYLARVGRPVEALTFAPDAEGMVPVLDEGWFDDDVVARTHAFLRATFGEATLGENLRFIEAALGKSLRRYFVSDFYRDHLLAYKRRPIYWMVQSPRRGFRVLVYLHCYTRDTMGRVLHRYLRPFLAKARRRLPLLGRREAAKLGRTLAECEAWAQEVVAPLARRRVALDLDDGVAANYPKLGAALAPIAGLAGEGE